MGWRTSCVLVEGYAARRQSCSNASASIVFEAMGELLGARPDGPDSDAFMFETPVTHFEARGARRSWLARVFGKR